MTQPPYGPNPPPEWPPLPGAPADPPPEQLATPADEPAEQAGRPAKGRAGLIVVLVAAVALLLGIGGVGAWLLLRGAESRDGAPEPTTAVSDFLQAVYIDQDAEAAADLVCAEARDSDAITGKVEEIQGYEDSYDNPRFEWTEPRVDEQDDERAIVSVDLRVTTADEKTAGQKMTFTVVQKTGWWVCEVA